VRPQPYTSKVILWPLHLHFTITLS
jgi:hypothetical protein